MSLSLPMLKYCMVAAALRLALLALGEMNVVLFMWRSLAGDEASFRRSCFTGRLILAHSSSIRGQLLGH